MVIVSPFSDIYRNLAFEDLLFRSYGGEGRLLLLYVNRPSVVIGRFQNPWAEADLKLLDAEGCLLARRISGGGAVYHDGGNLNFSLFSSRNDFDRADNIGMVSRILTGLGIGVRFNERMDITLAGKKISGSAYRILKTKAYHHGTLLIDADLAKARECLRPSYEGIESRGVKSVPSPIVNIRDLFPDMTVERVISAFAEDRLFFGGDAVFSLPSEDELDGREQDLRASAWIFGKTPAFAVALEGRSVVFQAGQMPGEDGFSLPL